MVRARCADCLAVGFPPACVPEVKGFCPRSCATAVASGGIVGSARYVPWKKLGENCAQRKFLSRVVTVIMR